MPVRRFGPAAGMLSGILALYTPVELLSGNCGLVGLDYYQIHLQRIRYALECLSVPGGTLPGWHTRELLGAPFWSNLQSFPWIPSRLALLACDPFFAYAPGVVLAALLAACFTYLFCRELGLGRVGSAAAGFTFAGSGYFAARVMAGHLPLLEAYPALPLLLWLVERPAHRGGSRPGAGAVLALSAAGCATFLAGHPQLPVYAVATAALYAWYRHPRSLALKLIAALALGVGCGSVVLWPMVRLLGRSTRLLALSGPGNNVALPYQRLGAFVFPWQDGWPREVDRRPPRPFAGYPDEAYFWDTVCYVGLLPLAAVVGLAVRCARARCGPAPPWPFFAVLGAATVACALPLAGELAARLPGTILRSPARLLYLTGFCLSLVLGSAVHLAWRAARRDGRALPPALVAAALLVHAMDLGSHARWFVRTRPLDRAALRRLDPWLVKQIGDGRAAIDFNFMIPENRRFDDAGFFDSIMLSKPYRAVLDLARSPAGRNVQTFCAGAELPAPALAGLGVRAVMTTAGRSDLTTMFRSDAFGVYAVPDPAPRALFFPHARAAFLEAAAVHLRLRAPDFDLRHALLLERGAAPGTGLPGASGGGAGQASYRRVSPDEIAVRVQAREPGYVLCTESWDPGWSVRVDGAQAPLLLADDFLLAVAIPAGEHEVRFRFTTPHAAAGAALSLVCLVLLAALAHRSRWSAPDGSHAPADQELTCHDPSK